MRKNKILIAPLFGIGDTLLTTPALKILKEKYPKFHITYFTFSKATYEILKMNPNIDKILYYPLLKSNKLASLIFIFKKFSFKFDIVINFYPSNRKEYNIFSFLTFTGKRVGHRYKHNDLKELNWLKNRTIKEEDNFHCVEENIRLLKFFNIDISEEQIPDIEIFLTDNEVKQGKTFLKNSIKNFNNQMETKNIGIHVGSSLFKNHKYKRWPKEYFLEVINYFSDYNFFLFGTNEEKEENKYIFKNAINKNIIIVENKSIREVAAIIKNLDLFISNDSGLMHLSAATGTKTIGIFGPTNPAWVRPWGKKHIFLQSKLKCAPCFYYSPKPLTCNNSIKWQCLKSITPNILIEKIKML